MTVQTLFRKLALLLLPLTLLVAGTNYVVDPANIFSPDDYVSGIADIMTAGRNVDNVTNYDERKLQEQVVHKLSATPDLIVLGSSRIMEIGKELMPGKAVINCGVSHAQVKDIIALAGLLDSSRRMPPSVLLNVDAGMVSEHPTEEWKSLIAYYDHFLMTNPAMKGVLEEGGTEAYRRKKITSLFSLDYFQSSLSFITRRRAKGFRDVGTATPEGPGRFSDGTVAYPYEYRTIKPLKVNMEAFTAAQTLTPTRPDPEQQRLFEGLLDAFQAHNVKVSLCLLPYHPVFYHQADSMTNGLLRHYEAYYREQAAKRGLRITGSLDPAQVGAGPRDFYDAFHSPKPSIKRFLNL